MADYKKKPSYLDDNEEKIEPEIVEEKEKHEAKKQLYSKPKRLVKIVLVKPGYLMVDYKGCGEIVYGVFEGKKVGDEVEVD